MKNIYSVQFKHLTGSVHKIHIPCFAFSDQDEDAGNDAGQCYTHTNRNASHRFLIKIIETAWKIKCPEKCNYIRTFSRLHL